MAVCPRCRRDVPFSEWLSVSFRKVPFEEMRFRCQCGARLSSPRDVGGILVTCVLGLFIAYLLARHYAMSSLLEYPIAVTLWISLYGVLVWPRIRLREKR